MKKPLIAIATLLLLLAPWAHTAQAQAPAAESGQYIVISVKGKVNCQGKTLARGSKLDASSELCFSSKEDAVVAFSPSRKTVHLGCEGATANSSGEFLNLLTDALVMPPKYKPTATRANPGSGNDMYALKSFFKGNTERKVLVTGNTAIALSPEDFVLDHYNYFLLKIEQEEGSYERRLTTEENMLLLEEQAFAPEGETHAPTGLKQARLYYRSEHMEEPMYIAKFVPVFYSEKELLAELKLLTELFQGATEEDIFNEAMGYLNATYGSPLPSQIRKLVHQTVTKKS